ncbi:MAG: hemolysin family protein [Lachnospiraceae bacterium]|nr:hemolysin family protein [Lachnospiraceae bacterium]
MFFKKKDNKKTESEVIENEIISMVNEGHEQGVLETTEAAMINNIFDFIDKEAGDIMTNRTNIVALDKDTTLKDSLQFMLSQSYSRYPVYEESLDHIVGILYLKDAMRFHAKDETIDPPICEIKNLLRKPMIIPETMNIDDLFKRMQSRKTQMAIVIDEYGQTVGLVAMEDILEEIVGNIMDEYDVEERHIYKRGKGGFMIDGSTPLTEIEEKLGISFEVTEFETLNGYMISKLERLPLKDDKFKTEVDGYEFEITAVENRMVTKVSVKKINKKEED